MEYKTEGNGQMFIAFDELLTDDDTEIIPNEIGFEMMKNILPDEIIKWEKLRYWLEQQMSERRLVGDVYRYTAYEATLKKMEELNNE